MDTLLKQVLILVALISVLAIDMQGSNSNTPRVNRTPALAK